MTVLTTAMEKTIVPEIAPHSPITASEQPSTEIPINASGHQQELDRNFSLLSSCGIAITSGNTWIAMGGSVVCFSRSSINQAISDGYAQVVAIYNGGAPGIIYEL